MRRLKLPPSTALIVAMFLLAFSWPTPARSSGSGAQKALLESAVNSALAILQDSSLSSAQNRDRRRQKLRDTLYPQFDFDRMARGAVGHPWKAFSKDQQHRFTQLFQQLLENTYMSMIERYQGEQVVFTKEVPLSSTVVRVDSVIYSKGQKYDMSYRLGNDDGNWKVFDVIIEGVSVIANYRAQFRQLLRQRQPDVESVLAKLADKVNETGVQ